MNAQDRCPHLTFPDNSRIIQRISGGTGHCLGENISINSDRTRNRHVLIYVICVHFIHGLCKLCVFYVKWNKNMFLLWSQMMTWNTWHFHRTNRQIDTWNSWCLHWNSHTSCLFSAQWSVYFSYSIKKIIYIIGGYLWRSWIFCWAWPPKFSVFQFS